MIESKGFNKNKYYVIIYNIYMQNRVFSREQTNSYSDVMNKKKNTKCEGLCECKNICDESPLNIIQGKTSYACNNTTQNYICNTQKILYPYGLYSCETNNCNNCEADIDLDQNEENNQLRVRSQQTQTTLTGNVETTTPLYYPYDHYCLVPFLKNKVFCQDLWYYVP